MVGEWVRVTAAHSLRDKNNRIAFRYLTRILTAQVPQFPVVTHPVIQIRTPGVYSSIYLTWNSLGGETCKFI